MKRILLFSSIFMLVGCIAPDPHPIGSMLPGKIICLSDGKTLPMEIQLSSISHPTGKMTAIDPSTSENFSGTYTCMVETKTVQDSRPTFLGAQETKTSLEVSDVVPGVAVLVGDKGTVLNIKMTIKAGNPPIGYGNAEDNKSKKYTIQF